MTELNEAAGATKMILKEIAASCTGGSCPTVYRTDRGTVLVQGYAVTSSQAGIDLPPGELLVEVPADLLAAAVRAEG
ncbi:hypothetical protein [Paractinoplanes hotanensis]|uniref:Uncharacterized protein n=1 Tax=Paractinoplanes hotanensis TaxID=2906497 RepID=A0ABT0XZH6_9ACTN|nr:hypothetical protein [Actinoplanes hotanensis]MCM4079010.1 hypothetical protein [Actinoplanes hotanensis]